jgi:magnesium transporter
MLRAFVPHNGRPIPIDVTSGAPMPHEVIWIDLHHPTEAEEAVVERALGVEIPTREEMQEIEETSRLYYDNGALFMTANVICRADTTKPQVTAVTFVLVGDRLVTIRYDEPKSFESFLAHAERHPAACASGPTALIGLLEAIVDRIADVLERVGADVEKVSHSIFDHESEETRISGSDFQALLREVGQSQTRAAKARDSLISLNRLLSFLALPREDKTQRDLRDHVDSLARDVASLTQHAGSISGVISFQLDALLGMINVEQNGIIKIFSVAAVAMMPPTLIASIYGMNFKSIPELQLDFGYPMALVLMVVSAVLPYFYFKRRGWL